jgi:hypothetical protein
MLLPCSEASKDKPILYRPTYTRTFPKMPVNYSKNVKVQVTGGITARGILETNTVLSPTTVRVRILITTA